MCSSTPVVVVCQRCCVERVCVFDGSAGLRVDVILLLLLAVTQLAWNRDNVGWGLAKKCCCFCGLLARIADDDDDDTDD